MQVAHLVDQSGTGVELFEFPDPAAVPLPDDLEFWRIGVSHIAVTVDDIDAARRSLEDHGGTARTQVFMLAPDCQVCYCRDPWGNAIEFSTLDYRSLAAVAMPIS
jgi:catechol 2,3-dioxygenase-like lactoylglutathione lyase family enzyme